MSRKFRFASVSLTVLSITCGSLSASPLGRGMLRDDEVPTLTAFVDWVSSIFSWEKPRHQVVSPLRPKIGNQLDPNGNH
jgi:hypothetical protein